MYKYTALALLVLATGSLLLFSALQPYAASAAARTRPSLTILSIAHEFDANDCAVATIRGKNFTSPGFTGANAVLKASGLSITPATVSIGFDGNFDTRVNLCYPYFHPGGSRLVADYDFTIRATDTMTGEKATSMPLTIVDPTPHIRAYPTHVSLYGGCATVTIIGDHFIASGLATNYVSLHAYKLDMNGNQLSPELPHQPFQINTLGGGNIAISAMFCGLTAGDSFKVQATDEGSYYQSNAVIIRAH